MFTTQFFMPMIPPTVTFQAKALAVVNGKPVTFDSAALKAIKAKLMGALAGYAPPERLTGPIRLLVKWCFPARDKHSDGEWKITKPDVDNLQKALMDCMTKLRFWKDDAQVCSLVVEKFWSEVPGIFVHIEQLGGDAA